TTDPVFPERPISLLGSSLGYVDVFTRPDHLDFGSILPGCMAGTRQVEIVNAGTSDIEVQSIALAQPSTEIQLTVPTVPLMIPAGGTREFGVSYSPSNLGVDTDVAEVTVRDLPYPLVVPVQGEGTMNPRATEEFQQLKNDSVDVLFVIDDSCSMGDE